MAVSAHWDGIILIVLRRQPSMASEQNEARRLSRRELLKRVGAVGAAAAVPAWVLSPGVPAALGLASFVTLTAAEGRTLEAIVARLIPTDENGPGATEARAAVYIDRALSGALASSRDAYAAGLESLDSYARASRGAPFAELPSDAQDAVLGDLEENAATGFTPDSSAFFNLVRTHTIEGTFCDPHYGGNANFAGWDLIGYPGVRIAVTANQQRMEIAVRPTHRSAYDFGRFAQEAISRGR